MEVGNILLQIYIPPLLPVKNMKLYYSFFFDYFEKIDTKHLYVDDVLTF